MRTGKFGLVIVWTDGHTDIYKYASERDAEQAADRFLLACGNQIEWYGVRPERS